jgi:hypothetical protein
MVDNSLEPIPTSLTQRDPFTDPGHHHNNQQRWYDFDLDSVSAEYRQLLAGFEVILTEAARRIEAAPGDWLPGFADVVEGVVLYATTTKRPVYGWYCANAWHDSRSGQRFAEIVINADTLNRPAEAVLTTLIHELVHAYAEAMDLKDTSRRGAYHNTVFADLAMKAGLNVQRHPIRGHVTAGISPVGHQLYDDLVQLLDTLLRLHRSPGPDRDPDPGGATGTRGVPPGPDNDEPTASKYVMAQCGCTNDRGRPVIIRVARGNWSKDNIWCRRCDQCFTDPASGLSESPQARAA